MNIIVNGKSHLCGDTGPGLTMDLGEKPGQGYGGYDQIVQMAGYDQKRILSVTYTTRRKGNEQRQGSLHRGESILIEDGMVFSVADTSNA